MEQQDDEENFLPNLLNGVPDFPSLAEAQLGHNSLFIKTTDVSPQNLYFDVTANMANYLKIYNQTTQSFMVTPSTTVYNDVSLNTFVAYGLTQRVSLFTEIPLRSVHEYSLNPTLTGKGFGDIEVGAAASLLPRTPVSDNDPGLDVYLSTTIPVGANDTPEKGEYPLGLNAYQFTFAADGYNPIGNYGLVYSAYYNMVGGNGSLNYGDWTGFYLLVNKYSATQFGNFLFEAGVNTAYKFDDRISGSPVNGSYDYYVNLLAGITYYYSNTFDFRVGVPYTFYQKGSWFTNYSVLLGVEYQIGL